MSAVMQSLGESANSLFRRGQALLDNSFPPEQRAQWIAKIKASTSRNPKVMSFLLINVALTGGPLALFILFGTTVFVFSLIVALVVALLVAVCFTVFCAALALIILLPVIFFTTMTACCLSLTALGGYWAYKWLNSGHTSLPTTEGNASGDQLNLLTGGKLNWLAGQAQNGMVGKSTGPIQQDRREPSARNTPRKLNERSNNGVPNSLNGPVSSDGDKNKERHGGTWDRGEDDKENETSSVSSGLDGAKKATSTKDVAKAIDSAPGDTGLVDRSQNSRIDAASNASGTGKGDGP